MDVSRRLAPGLNLDAIVSLLSSPVLLVLFTEALAERLELEDDGFGGIAGGDVVDAADQDHVDGGFQGFVLGNQYCKFFLCAKAKLYMQS
jgi:hypothetical protein